MKNIIDLYEASILADVEDTLKNGDKESELYNEFSRLSEIVLSVKNWNKNNKNSFSVEVSNVPNILNAAGFTHAPEYLKIVFTAFKPIGLPTKFFRGSISINTHTDDTLYKFAFPFSDENTLNNYLKKVIGKYVLKDAKTFVNYIKYKHEDYHRYNGF